jgi:hypothetical protein
MFNQNAMVRRHCQRRWVGLRSVLVLFWVCHCSKRQPETVWTDRF